MAEIIQPPSETIHRPRDIVKNGGIHPFTWCLPSCSNFKGTIRSSGVFPDSGIVLKLFAVLHIDENTLEIWFKSTRTEIPFRVHFETSLADCYGSEFFKSSRSTLYFETQSSCLCASVQNPWKQKNVPKQVACGDSLPFPDDTVTLQCYISLYPCDYVTHFDNLLKLSKDFKQVMDCKASTDVILRVGNEDICVHSWILSERSPRLATYLKTDGNNQIINISNQDVSVVKALVSYMYTGTIGNFEISLSSVTALCLYAEDCEVSGSQSTCANILDSMLTKDNVCSVLEAADHCDDFSLRGKCLKLIFRNFTYVANLPAWDSLVSDNPHLSSVVLKYISRNLLVH